jgi:predicted amidohydrolase YtcJ
MSASLAILNAKVITLDPKRPKAQAVAVQNNRILAVGSNGEVRKHICKYTNIIDAENKPLVPGLVDCHVHMTELGFFLQNPDLRNAGSIEELQKRLRKHASKCSGEYWILGGRWDQEKFVEKRYPTRWDLDDAVVDRPVFLVRVCGHIGVANSEALRLAGITKETVMEGGRVRLDEATGQPDGIVEGNTMRLIWEKIPKPSPEALKEACLLASAKAVEAGLTCVHWLVESEDEIRVLRKLESEGKLPLRVYLGIPIKLLDSRTKQDRQSQPADALVRIGFVKLFADGSLGSRTAALKRPYSDAPKSKGLLLKPKKELEQLIHRAHEAGFQVGVHAIGDRAIGNVLDAYEQALRHRPRQDHRHRIEHCSVLNPQLIKKIGKMHVIASVQPHFIVSDFWLPDRLGKQRARWTYPLRTLTKNGVTVASGSDSPIEEINPILGIWAAVAKRGSGENLTVKEALQTYTVNAAFTSFDEVRKGTIQVGSLADFTVLSDDPFNIKPDAIRKIVVEMTIVDGRVVYSRARDLESGLKNRDI